MKIIIKDDQKYLLRFDRDEEVMEVLAEFCTAQKIEAGSFQALGACREAILSYYNLRTKRYQDKTFTEDLEIITIVGNIGKMNGKTIIHAHGSFSNSDYNVIAGHVKKLVISATCEISLTTLRGRSERKFDEQTGLNLIS